MFTYADYGLDGRWLCDKTLLMKNDESFASLEAEWRGGLRGCCGED